MVIYEEHTEEDFIKILSKRDYTRIKKRIASFILNNDGDDSVFTNIPAQFARLDTLKLQAENDEDNEKMKKLIKLDKYLFNMQPVLPLFVYDLYVCNKYEYNKNKIEGFVVCL